MAQVKNIQRYYCYYLKLEGNNMQGINEELNQVIKDEVIAKENKTAAKELVEVRRPITRRAIEDIRELTKLEKDLYAYWVDLQIT